jgi:hypothetical protein
VTEALVRFWNKQDEGFFRQHPDRKAHIRASVQGECQGEFWSLGPHDKNRRRILLCRVDFSGNFLPDNKVLKVPMLAFSDETIEDRDDVLLPIIQRIMADQI